MFLLNLGDIAIRGTPVDDRSPVCSRRSMPIIEKNIELSSKVFSVSNNLITDNNIIIILVITFRYLTV